jgi:nitrite reductase/ring-hydroxylating ferredoxin subunit
MAERERVIGAGAELEDGGPGLRFTVASGAAAVPAFAVRFRGRIHAYVNLCAHRELELDWPPGEFFDASGTLLVCSVHGAMYDPESGRCVAGPCAGATLAKLQVIERPDGTMVIFGTDGADEPAASGNADA